MENVKVQTDKNISLEALDVNNWLKICDLTVNENKNHFFQSQMYIGSALVGMKKKQNYLL